MGQLIMRRNNAPVIDIVLPDGYFIRSYTRGDEEDWCLCCIDGKLGVEKADTAEFDRIMSNDDRVDKSNIYFLVSETEGIVGTTTYQFGKLPEEGYIHMVGFKKSHRGKGLSRALLQFAIGKIIGDGMRTVTLSTDDWRLPAIKSYLNCGFEPCLIDAEAVERWRKVYSELGIVFSN